MSKLSFRARALDAGKPMPIFMAEELPDLPDYSAINRAVPQMPSGMEKEEECEHHLQRAICTGLIIPTPEVISIEDSESYERLYKSDYKRPRQLIHMQPFAMEQDFPEYDMDSEDEKFVSVQAKKSDLTALKFEEMMDRLEKSSGQTVVTLHEAKSLLKEDDDLIIAVYDYWLNKRLKTVVPLIPSVKTEHRFGSSANNPYVAFRRRTEKMQTRKNRKNDETSYEKMLKLRRDLSRTLTLLELVKRREKTKREHLHLTIEVFEKRYQAQDFSGQLLAEVSAVKAPRPAFAPLFTNHFGLSNQNWHSKVPTMKEENLLPRREKRQYKRRKHKNGVASSGARGNYLMSPVHGSQNSLASSEEEIELTHPDFVDTNQTDPEGMFTFRRKPGCSYLPPITSGLGNWPWCSKEENGGGDTRYRYSSTAIATPYRRNIGLARRRIGRGGRVILDRVSCSSDDFWSSVDFNVMNRIPKEKSWCDSLFRPKTPPLVDETSLSSSIDVETNEIDSLPNTLIIDVENISGCGLNKFHSYGESEQYESEESNHVGGKRGRGKHSEESSATVEVSEKSTPDPDARLTTALNNKENKIKSDVSDSKCLRFPANDVYTFDEDVEEISDRTRDWKFRSCKNMKSLEKNKETQVNTDGCVINSFYKTDKVLKQMSDLKCNKYLQRNNNMNKVEVESSTVCANNNNNKHRDESITGKLTFRRNYRLGGFKLEKKDVSSNNNKNSSLPLNVFATSEIVLQELFADSSINPGQETENELEASDDSFAILDKLGLDDEFIRKEPDIGLDVEGQVNKPGTGQTNDNNSISYQKQRLKKMKNIFDFSETDFLKYETDCDVDDIIPEITQNDIVGMSSLFGLTPNSRFNVTNTTCLSLENVKNETMKGNNTVEIVEDVTASSKSDVCDKNVVPSTSTNYRNITANLENQQITLHLNQSRASTSNTTTTSPTTTTSSVCTILASRLNLKRDYPSYQFASQPHTTQSNLDMYALNHHNYTISGPLSYNMKRNSVDNTQKSSKQTFEETVTSNSVKTPSNIGTTTLTPSYITEILSNQLARGNNPGTLLKTNRPPTTTVGFTKLSTLSGAHITHNLGHTTINHDPSNSNYYRSHQDTKVVNSTSSELVDQSGRLIKEVARPTRLDGTGIVRTFRTGISNLQLTSDGNLLVQDVSKRTVANGPATSEYSQRRVLRQHQAQSTISAQNPTITQLVTNQNVFTIEGLCFS